MASKTTAEYQEPSQPSLVPLLPLKDRAPATFRQQIQTIAFFAFFLTFTVLIHGLQLLVLPLHLIPWSPLHRVTTAYITESKEAFASLLIAICHLFGPTKLRITVDESVELDKLCNKVDHATGEVHGLKLDHQSVIIANHAQYADWIGIWIFLAFAQVSSGLCIILKASLKHAPVVGPAMQLFGFAFVGKSAPLQKAGIIKFAKKTVAYGRPFALLLFPEGTLFSRLTRPKSASFAATSGVADCSNLLLPRTTGLLYCLRALSTVMTPTVYDLTIGYDFVPEQGYAQDYYSLKSIFARGEPSPRVHLHVRQLALDQIPIGALRPGATPEELDAEVTDIERATFQEWTRRRWEEKDALMTSFYQQGEFPSKQGARELKVRLRKKDLMLLASVLLCWSLVVKAASWALRA